LVNYLDHQMLSSVPLENWVVIVPGRDAQAIDHMIGEMQSVANPIRFRINRPRDV